MKENKLNDEKIEKMDHKKGNYVMNHEKIFIHNTIVITISRKSPITRIEPIHNSNITNI